MSLNLENLINSRPIGNIHSGEKSEDDKIHKHDYFNVHLDKSTSSMAVEIFNEVYKNPKTLKIRFINQNPIDVHLERYQGKRRKCFGNGKEATVADDKGNKNTIECNVNTCPYFKSGQCKYRARLYFVIDKLENEGIWCYPFGSEKGIRNIAQRIIRANRIKEDLTKDWYELFLNAEIAPTKGENYIPDIRKLESKNDASDKEKNEEKKEETKIVYMILKGFDVAKINNIEYPMLNLVSTDKKEVNAIILPNTNQDILNCNEGTIIAPLKMINKDNNLYLMDYKIVKEVKETIEENKKAV